MNTKLAVGAGVAVVAGAITAFFVLRDRGPHHEKHDTSAEHGIDEADTNLSLIAMENAPEGATSCETAYNAVDAEHQAMKLRGGKSLFEWVAPRSEFLAACATLPEGAQKCMMPRYRRDHADECLKLRPSEETLKKMVVAVPPPPAG